MNASHRRIAATTAAVLSVSLAARAADPVARELHLKETLEMAEKFSPSLDAHRYSELAAEAEKSAAYAGYMPRIEAQALWTKGFPGSAGATDIGGLMVSPYHHGPSAGLFLKDTLWDFGRTSSQVRLASRRVEADRADEHVTRLEVDQVALRLLYSCSHSRRLSELWHELDSKSERVKTEVQRYVSTGQRSIVEKYLSEAQYEEAVTSAADYTTRYETVREQLSVVLGVDPREITCPDIASLVPETEHLSVIRDTESPIVQRAGAEVLVADARVDRAKAEHMPSVVAVASLGMMQATELDFEKKNWSFAVGLHVPLFEGLKVTNEVKRESALREQRSRQLEAARLGVRQANLRYEEIIRSARVRTGHLAREVTLAHQAFDTAQERYESLKGTVVDVREAIRNLARVETALADAQAQYLNAMSDQALLNGAR